MAKCVAIMANSLKFGGAERVMADLSIFLHENGYEVHLFLMDDTDVAYNYKGEIHKISFGAGPLLSLSYLIMTRRYKRKFKIDYAISAMEFMNFINIMTHCGEKMIPTMHNYKLQCEVTPTLKDKFIEWVFKKNVKKTHKIITVSKAIREKLIKLYPDVKKEAFITIYNASNVCQLKKLSEEDIPDNVKAFMTDVTFVNMARFVHQKSLDRLVLAFNEVVQHHPHARLVLIGDGEDREKLENLAEYLGIREKILITGFLKNPFSIISKATAFVLSSHYEGFGNVLVEALCCGRTVISVDCFAGPREILSPNEKTKGKDFEFCEYGILTKFYADGSGNGVSELAKAMEAIIKNPEIIKEYENKAEKRAFDFMPERVYEIWNSILD